jgi:hypothetical protein
LLSLLQSNPAPATLQFSNQYGNGLQLANLGNFAKGVTRDGSWQSVADSITSNNPVLPEEWSAHFMVKAPSSTGLYSTIFLTAFLHIRFYGGTLQFVNKNNVVVSTNISYTPTRPYIVSIKRQVGTGDRNGDGNIDDYEFSWSVKNLSLGTVQTEITERGGDMPVTGVMWKFGTAQFNFEHVQGPVVVFNGVGSQDNIDAVNWLTAQFVTGGFTTTTTTVQVPTYQIFSRKRETRP